MTDGNSGAPAGTSGQDPLAPLEDPEALKLLLAAVGGEQVEETGGGQELVAWLEEARKLCCSHPAQPYHHPVPGPKGQEEGVAWGGVIGPLGSRSWLWGPVRVKKRPG